jgi:serine/threonine-protein kinase
MYDTFFLGKDRPCYSMKLLEGIRLSTLISYRAGHKGGLGIPLNRFCDVFRKLCDILSYVHDKGVIHLDVKPENIIAGTYGEVWLMDWGNARLFDPKPYYDYLSVHLNSITWTDIEHEAANIILGTPHYMSPEQTNMPRESLTPASDIFSAGIILYQMLTGIHPFTHVEETREVLVEIRNYTPPPPHEINSDVPVRLSVICERMLEKAPDKRYQDMKEVLEDFDEFYNSGMAFAIRNYQKGELVCREGEVGDYSFKILSGRVEVFKTVDGKKKPLAVLGANEIVGELAVFSKQPRSATVVALEPTTIRIMDKASVEKELEKLSPWVGNMITSLSKRFIEMNDKIVGLE